METALLQNVTGEISYLTRYLHNGKIPVAVWDFSDDWTSHDWSFSRASAARYFDATGLVELGADLPRMVAASGKLALLVEPASGNDCDASNITLIDIASDGTPPNVGGVEMTRLTDGDGAGYLQFNACSVAGLAVGDPVVFSCVLHAGTTSVVDLWVGIGTTGVARTRARFDLGNETATVFGDPDIASPVALMM